MARRAKTVEARYKVNIVAIKAWDIAKTGSAIKLKIRDREELLGTIEIGQGTFGWKGAHRQSGFKRIPWRAFADMLDAS